MIDLQKIQFCSHFDLKKNNSNKRELKLDKANTIGKCHVAMNIERLG